MKEKILVSACLLGVDCKYSGGNNYNEKVLKYLWDDAFKFYRDEIFKGEFTSLEKVIKEFTTKTKDDRFGIFKDSIKADIIKKSN